MDNSRTTLVAFITGALSFAVGLAWSNTFQAIFKRLYNENTWLASLIYAITITIVGVLAVPFIVRKLKN